MGRVHLKVGDGSRDEIPTDERLKAVRDGAADPDLEALCFQFGRYLLVASSRAGGQPANLQGIWNESVSPPWGSKYTININTQMNYWPAEVTNLSECHQPLFDMLKDIAVTGAKTARVYYDCGGWVAHHNIDLWRGTAPVDAAKYGMWPVGGAWLCQHLWEHYLFTGDRQFLEDSYPIMKGSAQFLLELLVEDPKHHWLVTPFSMSPEHGYYDAKGQLVFLSPAPTLDVALIRELFPHCIEAGKLLGVDEEFRARLEAALARIPPYRVNGRGFLQEWIEDWKPGSQGHNVSPDFPFYPGSSITLRGNPELARAIGNWMETRRPRGGWPTAWDLAMWARLERGDQGRRLHAGDRPEFARARPAQRGLESVGLQLRLHGGRRGGAAPEPCGRDQPAARAAGRLDRRLGHGPAGARRLRSRHAVEGREAGIRADSRYDLGPLPGAVRREDRHHLVEGGRDPEPERRPGRRG